MKQCSYLLRSIKIKNFEISVSPEIVICRKVIVTRAVLLLACANISESYNFMNFYCHIV